MRVIEVLGPGCQKCQYTEKVIFSARSWLPPASTPRSDT